MSETTTGKYPHQIYVYLDEETYKRVVEMAEDNEQTVSALCRRMIKSSRELTMWPFERLERPAKVEFKYEPEELAEKVKKYLTGDSEKASNDEASS